jgi:hypothetical protein
MISTGCGGAFKDTGIAACTRAKEHILATNLESELNRDDGATFVLRAPNGCEDTYQLTENEHGACDAKIESGCPITWPSLWN